MAKKKKNKQGPPAVARNKKAFHDYVIEQKFEAGVVLLGSEVKSIRNGKISLSEAYAKFSGAHPELFLHNCHVAEYAWANRNNHDPLRPKKLLLNKRELSKLSHATIQGGKTIVALAAYFKNGKLKIQIALAKGKKNYDKRQTLRKKTAQRDIETRQ